MNVMYTCGQSYPTATWSRYTDSSCQTIDEAQRQEIVPLGFCRASSQAEGVFEFNSRSMHITCGSSGLATTMWSNSDCTGSGVPKPEAAVGDVCSEKYYYGSHVKIESGPESGCEGTSSDST